MSRNSSNADIFNNIKLEYEEALEKCGHTTMLTYTIPIHEQNNVRRKRQRKIVWFNPSFNLDVSTNVAKNILKFDRKSLQANYTRSLTKTLLKYAIAILKTCHKLSKGITKRFFRKKHRRASSVAIPTRVFLKGKRDIQMYSNNL